MSNLTWCGFTTTAKLWIKSFGAVSSASQDNKLFSHIVMENAPLVTVWVNDGLFFLVNCQNTRNVETSSNQTKMRPWIRKSQQRRRRALDSEAAKKQTRMLKLTIRVEPKASSRGIKCHSVMRKCVSPGFRSEQIFHVINISTHMMLGMEHKYFFTNMPFRDAAAWTHKHQQQNKLSGFLFNLFSFLSSASASSGEKWIKSQQVWFFGLGISATSSKALSHCDVAFVEINFQPLNRLMIIYERKSVKAWQASSFIIISHGARSAFERRKSYQVGNMSSDEH